MMKKGLAVNLYLIGKMLEIFTVQDVRNMMEATWDIDRETREYRGLTFAEYVDAKRSFLASILGKLEYV